MTVLGLLLTAQLMPWAVPPTLEPRYIAGSNAHKKLVPARVVSLAPSVAEFMFAFGAGSRLVGVTRYADFPAAVEALPKVGGFLDPNVETIVALAPDLVIAVANAQNKPILERLAGLKIAVLCIPGNSFADTFHSARAIASALGGDAPKKAEVMLADIRARTERVLAGSKGRAPVRVAFVYDHNPLVVAGPGSFADTMLGIVRAKNVVSVDVAYPTYAIEQLLVDAPEVILDASGVHSGGVKAFWSRWEAIPAVANDQAHAFDATLMMRAGPRIVTALEEIASMINAARGRAGSRPPPERPAPDPRAGSGSGDSERQPTAPASPSPTR